MVLASSARRSWLCAAAFTGLCFALAFVWDVAYGLSFDHFAPARALSMEVSYFAIPMALCFALGFTLRRRLKFSGTDGALIAAVLSCIAAPFVMFLPVLFFDCAVLGACIG